MGDSDDGCDDIEGPEVVTLSGYVGVRTDNGTFVFKATPGVDEILDVIELSRL
jgi:hypothetical protein